MWLKFSLWMSCWSFGICDFWWDYSGLAVILTTNALQNIQCCWLLSKRCFKKQWWCRIDSTTTQDHCYFLYHELHRVAIVTGRWSTIHISRDNRLICYFCFYNLVEHEAHSVSVCPLHNSITDNVSITIWECSMRAFLPSCYMTGIIEWQTCFSPPDISKMWNTL